MNDRLYKTGYLLCKNYRVPNDRGSSPFLVSFIDRKENEKMKVGLEASEATLEFCLNIALGTYKLNRECLEIVGKQNLNRAFNPVRGLPNIVLVGARTSLFPKDSAPQNFFGSPQKDYIRRALTTPIVSHFYEAIGVYDVLYSERTSAEFIIFCRYLGEMGRVFIIHSKRKKDFIKEIEYFCAQQEKELYFIDVSEIPKD